MRNHLTPQLNNEEVKEEDMEDREEKIKGLQDEVSLLRSEKLTIVERINEKLLEILELLEQDPNYPNV